MIYIILVIIALALLYLIISYNNLIKNKNMVEEGWSSIDVQLKRRSNLIPNILNSVKGYMSHEKKLLEEITELRSKSDAADNVIDQGKAESSLSGSLMNLFAVAENYPELKANENFLDLQKQLQKIEDDIQNHSQLIIVPDKDLFKIPFSVLLIILPSSGKFSSEEIILASRAARNSPCLTV